MNPLQKWFQEGGVKAKPEYNLIKRAAKNPNSRRLAIHAACFECEGGDKNNLPDMGWQERIANCSIPNCPLFSFRPYQKKIKTN